MTVEVSYFWPSAGGEGGTYPTNRIEVVYPSTSVDFATFKLVHSEKLQGTAFFSP